jgi:ferredoxin/flavodoxin---NADP+ reductase
MDLAIIGAGPVGLFGVFYAGMRHMSTVLIENLPDLGGQLAALYPEKLIFDVAGFPAVKAKELVKSLREQARSANPDCGIRTGEKVFALERRDDGAWTVGTNKAVYVAKAVIITAGIGAFEPNRLPNKEAGDYEGKGLAYNVLDPQEFAGKRVLVVGGGDSAVDYALMLESVAAEVTLIHRRDQFRAHDASVAQLKASSVRVRLCHELKTIHGDGKVEGATIFDNTSGTDSRLDLDAIISGTGFKAALGPIKDWGLELKGNQIVVTSTGATNLPGVYAAGDVAWYQGKVRLIATGFGEVATAVNNAKSLVEPGAAVFPGHSSEAAAHK